MPIKSFGAKSSGYRTKTCIIPSLHSAGSMYGAVFFGWIILALYRTTDCTAIGGNDAGETVRWK